MNYQIASQLWRVLWQEYSARVSYARTYEEIIAAAGGTVANDHIAFRSLRMDVDSSQGKINLGIEYLEPIVKFLGYEAMGEYDFPETHLYARHYRHPQQEELDLPKLFISELLVEELPPRIQELIYQTVIKFNSPVLGKKDYAHTVDIVPKLQQILSRPWQPAYRSVVEEVNQVSQYGAWVLIHGYAVNHFTGYINRQNTPTYPDIDTTARSLAELGVPMKAEIEGNVAVGLRQTATQAVKEMVTVLDDATGAEIQIPWTYAYYELAQRYLLGVEPGKQVLFDGFLGKNAKELFEMTRLS